MMIIYDCFIIYILLKKLVNIHFDNIRKYHKQCISMWIKFYGQHDHDY